MANIIVSFFTPIYENGEHKSLVYYDGLINSLKENGNNILCVFSTDFIDQPWNGTNALKSNLDEVILKNEIKNFKADFCIAFNNSIPDFITESVDCPITLWHGDTFEFFNDKDKILSNLDRYDFICPFEDTADYLLNKGVNPSRIHQIIPATGVKNENLHQDKNISFIGSSFYSGYMLVGQLENLDRKKVRVIADKVYSESLTHGQTGKTTKQIIEEENYLEILNYLPEIEIDSLYSSEKRIITLSFLSHLGLEIFGGKEWVDLGKYFPWLALSYNPERVYSLEHNQQIYNTSKICVNISHSQAKIGFPWRVMDIMASNSCLMTDSNSGIQRFTKKYVDIPTFDSPAEAKALAIKLLKDQAWRSELVLKSQKCIEETGRWESRFKQLDDIFDKGLLGKSSHPNPGAVVYLKPVSCEKVEQNLVINITDVPAPQLKIMQKIKNKIKNMIY